MLVVLVSGSIVIFSLLHKSCSVRTLAVFIGSTAVLLILGFMLAGVNGLGFMLAVVGVVQFLPKVATIFGV